MDACTQMWSCLPSSCHFVCVTNKQLQFHPSKKYPHEREKHLSNLSSSAIPPPCLLISVC